MVLSPTCNALLQTMNQYIVETGRKFAPFTTQSYHETHESSKKNNLIGHIAFCDRWLIDVSIFDLLPDIPLIHPFESPLDHNQTITNEANGVFHTYRFLIIPLITFLKSVWHHLEFTVDHESKVVASLEGSEGLEPAQGRVDMVVAARNAGASDPFNIILLYEAKSPGTLHYWEWMSAQKGLQGHLIGNAVPISKQGRKYCAATGYPQILFGDPEKMVGMRFKDKDRDYWDSDQNLSADIFFQSDKECFLKCLVAVVVEKLAELDLI